MATFITNSDLSIGNDNEVLIPSILEIALWKNMPDAEEKINQMKGLIKTFEESGIEIGLCFKYQSHIS